VARSRLQRRFRASLENPQKAGNRNSVNQKESGAFLDIVSSFPTKGGHGSFMEPCFVRVQPTSLFCRTWGVRCFAFPDDHMTLGDLHFLMARSVSEGHSRTGAAMLIHLTKQATEPHRKYRSRAIQASCEPASVLAESVRHDGADDL